MSIFSNLFHNLKKYIGANDEKFTTSYDAKSIAKVVSKQIKTYEVARQFVLEELDAARYGNEFAVDFVKSSGFKPNEYINAAQHSFHDVSGPYGPQQFLLRLSKRAMYDSRVNETDLELRLKVVKLIMFKWKLGKYSDNQTPAELLSSITKGEKSEEGPFMDILNDIVRNDTLLRKVHSDSDIGVDSIDTNLKSSLGAVLRITRAILYLQGLTTCAELARVRLFYFDYKLEDHVFEFIESYTTIFSREQLKALHDYVYDKPNQRIDDISQGKEPKNIPNKGVDEYGSKHSLAEVLNEYQMIGII